MPTIIKPMGDRIVVKAVAPAKKEGLIHVPDNAQEKRQQGVVVAVGPGRMLQCGERVPLEVQPGDTVRFGRHVGNEVIIDNEPLIFMREADVIVKVG